MDILRGSLKIQTSIFLELNFQWKKQGDQNKYNKGYKLSAAVAHKLYYNTNSRYTCERHENHSTARAHIQHL